MYIHLNHEHNSAVSFWLNDQFFSYSELSENLAQIITEKFANITNVSLIAKKKVLISMFIRNTLRFQIV